MSSVAVRRFEVGEWAVYRQLRLRSLAESPEAFGAVYSEVSRHPDEFWRSRLEAASLQHDLPIVAEVDRHPAGLAWGKIFAARPETAHLFQMWVAPECRGRGVGGHLLSRVVAWAAEQAARQLELAVTLGNAAAMELYERAGFRPIRDPEPLRPGSTLRVQPMAKVLPRDELR